MNYDVAVVGLGGMGSAILAHCAARGAKAIGLEQFGPAHEMGSSSGGSRMIRKAYFEDPAYVPLLLRAYDLWRELERISGEELLTITGLLMVGQEDAPIVAGARRAAREHQLAIEVLEQRQILARYPLLQLLPNEIGVFEPDGGVLLPERAIAAHLGVATNAGAHVRFGTAVEHWEAKGEGFEVYLEAESRISAQALILAMGPWFKDALGISLRIQRNVQAWFAPASAAYTAARFPPFLIERENFPAPLYGFPDFGEGVKAAFHAHGEITDAQHLEREIDHARDIEPIVAAMAQWMPGAAGTLRAAKACPYTLTPDGHFVIDRHPAHARVVLCGGFSGHGFKFAPVVGEIAADLALEGGSRHRIDFLSHRRFR
ncbi:MAG: N-methyl-L-tryptophan oxidase [Chthoniobacterales bacterium]|nr:N-methyl-L-tryptophan oxidase [Chthoniobacterales bacterium]